ncbi:MAG TPA: arsenate reductase ArsC [Candidatus Acidoferrum sp.]|nr:arsenate reductase ArsC [Candidatus Acidoferrum sp.]
MKLLFLCTHNRCRSILAEAVTRQICGNLVQVQSAGSEPARKVHPLTLEQLALHHIPLRGLRTKSWSALEAFQPDFIITLCDSSVGESCPLGGDSALRIHWPLPDPTSLEDDYDACWQRFDEVIATLVFRMKRVRELLKQEPTPALLRRSLEELGNRYVKPVQWSPKRPELLTPHALASA